MFVKYTSEKGFSGLLTKNGYKIYNPMGKMIISSPQAVSYSEFIGKVEEQPKRLVSKVAGFHEVCVKKPMKFITGSLI